MVHHQIVGEISAMRHHLIKLSVNYSDHPARAQLGEGGRGVGVLSGYNHLGVVLSRVFIFYDSIFLRCLTLIYLSFTSQFYNYNLNLDFPLGKERADWYILNNVQLFNILTKRGFKSGVEGLLA